MKEQTRNTVRPHPAKKQPAPQCKSKCRPPVPSLAAVAAPIDGVELGYRWEPVGYFPSRTAARREVDALRAGNPELTFVILPQELAGKEPLYDALAAHLKAQGIEPPQSTRQPCSGILHAPAGVLTPL